MAPSVFNSTQVISVLASIRTELENSRLGLIQSLVLIVLLALAPAFFMRSLSKRKLPPAPPSWPLIGHLHLLGTRAHQSMAALSTKYAPEGIMYLKFGLKRGIIVSTPEMAKEIFKKHDLAFSQRPQMIVHDLLVTNKGVGWQQNNASWRNLRKIFIQEAFSPKQMQYAQQLRASEMDYMVNYIFRDVTRDPQTPIEVNKKTWVLTVNFIARLVLSKRYFSNYDSEEESQEAAELRYVMLEQFILISSIFPADSFPFLKPFDIGGLQKRTKALFPRLQGILTKILNERREKRKQEGTAHVDVDMVDVLLTNYEKGEITEGNLRSVVWDALVGGTETQITTIEWALAHIIADPNIAETLRAELDREVGTERRVAESDLPRLKYLNATMKETFRLHPPVPLLLPHETFEACTVAGYYIPPNTRLFVNLWAIGRDPRVWENPLEFRPERWILQANLQEVDVQGQHFNLIPFGAGRRICPAIGIGIAGVQLGIATLVQAFDWSLPDAMAAADMDMTEASGVAIPMATSLRAVATPRLAAHLYRAP